MDKQRRAKKPKEQGEALAELPLETKRSWFDHISKWVTLTLAIWGACSPFLFRHLGKLEEARKTKPALFIGEVKLLNKLENNFVDVMVPVYNLGSDVAYDVQESNLVDAVLYTRINEPAASNDFSSAQPSTLIDIPPHIVRNMEISRPLDAIGSDIPLRIGGLSARIRIRISYRDGDGKSHEMRTCIATNSAERGLVVCSTGWEGQS